MSIYTPILATLGYVMSADRSSVLLIHRNTRPDDVHYGKYNGLGGKLAPGEDIAAGIRRELYEEAGITADELILRGMVSWPGFGSHTHGWFAFIFRVDRWHGNPQMQNHEGTLQWVRLDGLHSINMWESDRPWIDLVFQNTPIMFHGVAQFDGQQFSSWSCTSLNQTETLYPNHS